MAERTIVAYFFSNEDRNWLRQNINITDETESLLIGQVEDNLVSQLTERGVLFNLPETVSDEPQPVAFHNINFQKRNFSIIDDFDLFPGLSPSYPDLYPLFYQFSLAIPLLSGYQSQLNELDIKIVEFNYPDKYTVRINDKDKLDRLSELSFVRNLRLYAADQTYANLHIGKMPEDSSVRQHGMLTVDIVLHDDDLLGKFALWLESFNGGVVTVGSSKIRCYVRVEGNDLELIANHPWVKEIYEYVRPKLHMELASSIIRKTNNNGNANVFPYQGEGQIVGIADTGIDDTHPDFVNRLRTITDWGGAGKGTDQHGHGSHVAGIVAGDGTASKGNYSGIAPKAKLFFQSLLGTDDQIHLPFQLQDLYQEAYNAGVRIHNNSWGTSAASATTPQSIEVDEFVWNNKDMLLVFSAGNDGQAGTSLNVTSGDVDLYSIGAPATAKNALTVGASRNSRTSWGYAAVTYQQMWPSAFPLPPHYNVEKISGDPQCLAGFSSRGPSDDDRIKPDVVAPGTDVISARSAQAATNTFWSLHPHNTHYAIMGGTSMAAPIVTGCVALVREYLQKEHLHDPSAALLKAIIINGATSLGGRDVNEPYTCTPNYNQGYGIVDLGRTFPFNGNNFFFHFADGSELKTVGQAHIIKVELKHAGWLSVTMVYTDFPARALQNNLNLVIVKPDGSKWAGNDTLTIPGPRPSMDTKNNVEVVKQAHVPSGVYEIWVTAYNLIKAPQDFAVVITTEDTGAHII